MSIQTNYDLYLNNIEELIEILELNFQYIDNLKVDKENSIFSISSNDAVTFSYSKISKMSSLFKEEDYGVNVNYTLTFNHYVDLSINCPDSIIKFVCQLMNCCNTDCLLMHNGNDPLIIRKNKEIELADNELFNYLFGASSKKLVISLLNNINGSVIN